MDDVRTAKKPGRKARGVKSRIFGVALVCLGALNLMLSARGGLNTEPFNYILIIAGILFFLTGSLRGGKDN